MQSAETKSTPLVQFEPFAAHTLIFALGDLAQSVLLRFLSDVRATQDYRQWLAEPAIALTADPATRDLVSTGLEGGKVTLVGRRRPNEFGLCVDHKEFQTVVAVGFDVEARGMLGLHVAEFVGDPIAALRFAIALSEQIRRSMPKQPNQSPLPHLTWQPGPLPKGKPS